MKTKPPFSDSLSFGANDSWLHYEHAPTYNENKQAFHAITDGRWKYIWRPLDGSEQLFDLRADPRELADLSDDSANKDMLLDWRRPRETT